MPPDYSPDLEHYGRYKPKGKLIRQLRKQRGWTHEELAERAKCSATTISNLEKGKHAYSCTIMKVSAAFGLKYIELLAFPPKVGAEKLDKPAVMKLQDVSILFDENKKDFDETRQLGRLIKAFAESLQVKVKCIHLIVVTEGSVLVRIKISSRLLERLFSMYVDDELSDLPSRILAIDFPTVMEIPLFMLPNIVDRFNFDPEIAPDFVRVTVRQPTFDLGR